MELEPEEGEGRIPHLPFLYTTPEMNVQMASLVAPVGISGGDHRGGGGTSYEHEQHGFSTISPMALELARAYPRPKFSGQAKDWPDFIDRWELFVERQEELKMMDESHKLQLFEQCIVTEATNVIILWRRTNMPVTYHRLMTHMEMVYGKQRELLKRNRIYDLKISGDSFMSFAQWQDFKAQYISALAEMKNVSTKESVRILFEKLSPVMKKWVKTEELKRQAKKPEFEVNGLGEISEAQAMVTLTSFMGTPPIQVERRTGQSFLVRCSNPDSG